MRVIAQQGDTVDVLCHRHLGRTAGVTEAVMESNPGISALGPVLPMGTAVELPDQLPAETNTNLIQLWD